MKAFDELLKNANALLCNISVALHRLSSALHFRANFDGDRLEHTRELIYVCDTERSPNFQKILVESGNGILNYFEIAAGDDLELGL